MKICSVRRTAELVVREGLLRASHVDTILKDSLKMNPIRSVEVYKASPIGPLYTHAPLRLRKGKVIKRYNILDEVAHYACGLLDHVWEIARF